MLDSVRAAVAHCGAAQPDGSGGWRIVGGALQVSDTTLGGEITDLEAIRDLRGIHGKDSYGASLLIYYNDKLTSIAGLRNVRGCLLYTSPSPRDKRQSRMPSSA